MSKNRIIAIILLFCALSIEAVQKGILMALSCLGAFILAIFLGKIIWNLKSKFVRR